MPSRTSLSPIENSPTGQHTGAGSSPLASDCRNINAPCRFCRCTTRAAAARVIETRAAAVSIRSLDSSRKRSWGSSEESLRVVAVAHQQVLGLLVVVEHHLVVLAPDAGLLVPTERGVRRVLVVAVRPHPAGLDVAAGTVGGVAVARPHPGAEAVQGVVG